MIAGLACDLCGTPLPGDPADAPVHCDDCLTIARPWRAGRAALVYRDAGRSLVLALKHGDRLDIARAAAPWLLRAARDIITPDTVLVPVPLHWKRLAARRYNQSALLAGALARHAGCGWLPDGLVRSRATPSLDGLTRDTRFATLQDAIRPHPRRAVELKGRPVIVVDDVMTSGATFAACGEAALRAGASDLCVLALARVAKDA